MLAQLNGCSPTGNESTQLNQVKLSDLIHEDD